MTVTIMTGDCRQVMGTLPEGSIHCTATSPPYYGLRSYGTPPVDWPAVSYSPMPGLPPIEVDPWTGDLGLEPTPEMYIGHMVLIFRAVWRVLREDGVVWLNIGDSYATGTTAGRQQSPNPGVGANRPEAQNSVARLGTPDGLKTKDLIGIPWRLAFALQADGWWLRSDVIWHKPNPMPESVTDRPTKAHEYVFLLSKAERYFYDHEAVKEPGSDNVNGKAATFKRESSKRARVMVPGNTASHREDRPNTQHNGTRNKRSVWTIATRPFSEAHFATMPPDLVEPCIKAGTSEHGCCPECGAPWERVVERGGEWRAQHQRETKHNGRYYRKNPGGGVKGPNTTTEITTTGWQPTCTHDQAAPVPCTVLDPFGGAGTVGLVADRLGRDAILIELNTDYAQMGGRRIAADAPLFANVTVTDDWGRRNGN